MIVFVLWKRRRQHRQRLAAGYVHPTLNSFRESGLVGFGDLEDIPPPTHKPRARAISSIMEIMDDEFNIAVETSSSMRVNLERENSRHVLPPKDFKGPPPEDVGQPSSPSVDLYDNNDNIREETEQRDSVADSEMITFLVHQDSGLRAPVQSDIVRAPNIPRREVVVELPPEYSSQ